MVGGLVEQQHVGRGEQELRELDAHQPAAAEARQGPGAGGLGEAQAVEHALDPRRAREAAAELERRARAVVAVRELLGHLRALAPAARHLGLELRDLALELVEMRRAPS